MDGCLDPVPAVGSDAPPIVVAVVAVVSFVLGVGGVGYLLRPAVRVVEPTALDAAHRAEVARARAMGFSDVVEDASTTDFVDRRLRLRRHQCVALVESESGPEDDPSVGVSWGLDGEESAYARVDSRVGLFVRCPPRAGSFLMTFGARTPSSTFGDDPSAIAPSTLRYTILVGVPSGLEHADELGLDAELRAFLRGEALAAQMARGPGASVVRPTEIEPSAALLFVPNRASFAALRALGGREGIVPRARAGTATDPFARPDDEVVLPRILLAGGRARVLAVLDAGALAARGDARCLELDLARVDPSPSAAGLVRRVAIPSLEESALAPSSGGVATDTLCPASGLFLYTTDEDDAAPWITQVRGEVRAGVEVEGSSFGAGEARAPILTPGVVAASARGCDAGDADACYTSAALAAAGIVGTTPAGLVDRLARACELGSGRACDQRAADAAAAGDDAAADTLSRRACALGWSDACLRRAAGFRDEDRFQEAYETYAFLCAQPGGSEGCAGARTMREWQLAPPGASEGGAAPSAPP